MPRGSDALSLGMGMPVVFLAPLSFLGERLSVLRAPSLGWNGPLGDSHVGAGPMCYLSIPMQTPRFSPQSPKKVEASSAVAD